MAYKIRVKSIKNEYKHSTSERFAFFLGLFLLIIGPSIYRMGLMSNFINVDFSLNLLIVGILITCIGLVIVLISKYTKYNKLLASILCFYWAINSFLLEDIIDKLKIASHNLLWAAEETGTYPLNPNMATNVARMDIINEGAIIIFTFIGIFLLILHIFRKKEEKTELPPEAPSPRTIF